MPNDLDHKLLFLLESFILLQANKWKAAAFPVAGAVIGGLVGGPIGLVAGLKLGGVAAVGGGIAGIVLKYRSTTFV